MGDEPEQRTLFQGVDAEQATVARPQPAGPVQSATGLQALMALRGIGPVGALALATRYPTWEELWEAAPEELRSLVGSRAGATVQELTRDESPSSRTDAEGCRRVGWFDSDYPEALRQLSTPAPVLWVRGSLPGPSLAIVGTREPDDYGLAVVDRAVSWVAAHRLGTVSGLAFGIDIAAHRATLKSGSPTWAILGGGVDTPTPAAHRADADAIVEAGGGLISEAPPGTRPSARTLVARNRLQVAFAGAVLVAQSGIPSGTLHTARFAIEQGRPLVVPRPPDRWAQGRASAGLLVLTDPDGCPPSVLKATGAVARMVEARRPAADVVLRDASDLEAVWDLGVWSGGA